MTALSASEVAAQSDYSAADDQPNVAAEPIEEITVFGHRYLRDLRLEVQLSRERVYGLFNSLNSNDEFDIQCRTAARTGTRTPRRVCSPQFVDAATSAAAKWYLKSLKSSGWTSGFSAAQAEMAVVPLKERLLAAEVEQLARENREFRRAIAEYQAVERRYEEARRETAIEASVSIIDIPRASQGNVSRRGTIVAPQAVQVAIPTAPRSREGWVKLRYSVLADGSTAEVRALDAMPPELDSSSTVLAAEAWTFEPATDGGVPIEWHNNLAVVSFSRPEAEYDGSIEFAEAYEEVAELIAGGRLEDAKVRNEQMQRVYAETLEEIALAQMQLAAIEHALERPQIALAAIRRATEPAVAALADEELKLALEHRFALELELGHAAEALHTYERRTELERLPPDDPLTRQGAALRQALAAPGAAQAVHGRIAANGLWEHALPSAAFELTDVQGRAEGIDLECHRSKKELPFQPNAQMTIPASWGACIVTLRGQPDTTFTLYEFL